MSTTGEIVSKIIKQNAQGYSRVADILPIINEVHKMFYKHENSTSVIRATDGALPTLDTTQGVYEYDAPVVNGKTPWCVSGVFLRKPISEDYNFTSYGYTEKPDLNTFDYMEFGGNYYFNFQFVTTLDSTVDNPAKIIFSRDPGTSTERFYLLMYEQPIEILSDRTQLQIPDRDGAHILYFFPACLKLIEAQNHGNILEAVEYIEQVLKPKMWKVLSSGVHGRHHKTRSRYF